MPRDLARNRIAGFPARVGARGASYGLKTYRHEKSRCPTNHRGFANGS